MDKKLFVRKIIDQTKYDSYVSLISSKFYDLNNWTVKTLYLIYNGDYLNEFIIFKFHVLRKWIDQNYEALTLDVFYHKLLYFLNLLKIDVYLNALEKNFLYEIKQTLFLINKPIKSLIVDFHLNTKEVAYFHFEAITLKHHHKFYRFDEFYLTNQRIVFLNDVYISWMNLKDLKFSYHNHYVQLKYHEYNFIMYYENLLNLRFAFKYLKQKQKYE